MLAETSYLKRERQILAVCLYVHSETCDLYTMFEQAAGTSLTATGDQLTCIVLPAADSQPL